MVGIRGGVRVNWEATGFRAGLTSSCSWSAWREMRQREATRPSETFLHEAPPFRELVSYPNSLAPVHARPVCRPAPRSLIAACSAVQPRSVAAVAVREMQRVRRDALAVNLAFLDVAPVMNAAVESRDRCFVLHLAEAVRGSGKFI